MRASTVFGRTSGWCSRNHARISWRVNGSGSARAHSSSSSLTGRPYFIAPPGADANISHFLLWQMRLVADGDRHGSVGGDPAGAALSAGGRGVGGEQPVELLARGSERGGSGSVLRGGAHPGDLTDSVLERQVLLTEREGRPVVAADRLPWRAELLPVGLDVCGPVRGERGGPAAVQPLDGGQPLVLERLQGRVDGSGAGGPGARTSLGDLLDQLVPVAGLLVQEQQDGGTDVAAGTRPTSSSTSSAPSRVCIRSAGAAR